ncbi:MAG: shikimate dehydrogenase [Flavobacterium sp.]|nr:MAG: shikimate dehydrogenase [Flavobacterium sp.]
MEKKRFGLIGKGIGYSFSRTYFTEKFATEHRMGFSYENLDLENIGQFRDLLAKHDDWGGLNVTIPYKQQIIPFLDGLSETAAKIGAVNTIEFANGRLIGHNTDYLGFQKSINPLIGPPHRKALILGTGGASKAVAFALQNLGIKSLNASRHPLDGEIAYDEITPQVMAAHQIIINCTPLGTSPNEDTAPEIPYQFFTRQHLAYDLVYNPPMTLFLRNAAIHGATTVNGLSMLQLQADEAWKIWTKSNS